MAVVRWTLIILLVGALVFIAGYGVWFSQSDTIRATVGGENFTLEIAADYESRERGYMDATEIGKNEGMVFVYPRREIRSFWMKNCTIDIDIIYLDGRGRIINSHTMKAEPLRAEDETQASYEARLNRYRSTRPAEVAIEFRAGTIERLGLKEGDQVEIDLRRLKRMAR